MEILRKLFAAGIGSVRFAAFSLLLAFSPLVNILFIVLGAVCGFCALLGLAMFPTEHLRTLSFMVLVGGAVACGVFVFVYNALVAVLDPLN